MIKKIASIIVLHYLRALSRLQLKKNPRAIIIGITGSAGKTSTKLAIVHILKHKGIVKESDRANSESGIPLNILGLSPINYSWLDWARMVLLAPLMVIANWEKFDYYVVEMGIDSPIEPKNMSYLLTIVKPDVGVVLNVDLSHAGSFDALVRDRDEVRRSQKLKHLIAQEKMKLVTRLDKLGIAVVNHDQVDLKALSRGVLARQISIGKGKGVSLRIVSQQVSRAGFSVSLEYQGQQYKLTLKDIFSDSYAYTFAAAIAVSAGLGIAVADAIHYLTDYTAAPGRLRVFAGVNDSTIIDSTYNASPGTMQEALVLLKRIAGRAKRIAVIGDMRELGASTKQVHKNLANWIMTNCDEAVLYGAYVESFTLPILQSQKFPVHHFKKMSDLTTYAKSAMKPKSWILVKGSQNTLLLERAVESLLQNPGEAKLLARRGKYWDKQRNALP